MKEIFNYGIFNWLVDYHYIKLIVVALIVLLAVAKDDIKILIKEITND